jgi:putative CRISPR-associated protein (TIGR02619 family)
MQKEDIMRFVLSTIGTSILTNLINRRNPAEGGWYGIMRDSANLKEDALSAEAQAVIDTLTDRALEELLKNDVRNNRRISAEFNGIYGIYGGQLPQNSPDVHYLICTDTAQGRATGQLVRDVLQDGGLRVETFIPPRLSTQDPESFTTGTKELIRWCEETIPAYRESGYQVIFNLVGGFKSLQGYMNTIGMFYADEVIYIFEAETSDLIKIPRLPIQIDTTVIREHLIEFALMDAGKLYPIEEVADLPETLLERVEENSKTYVGTSAWGQLIWNRTKKDLLAAELLTFPRLEYMPSFRDDFNGHTDASERVRLQEKLAEVSVLLDDHNGDPTPLKRHGGLQFEQFQGRPDVYKFRITRAIRVSCSLTEDGLKLRRFGHKNRVYKNP